MLVWWLESGRPAAGLTAALSLQWFWIWRGRYGEGSYWLEAFLELAAGCADDSITPRTRANAMNAAALFASRQGNYGLARERNEASAATWRDLNDAVRLADALASLGLTAWLTGDAARATELLEESLHMLEACGDDELIALPLRNLGMVARSQGDYARAADLFRASVARALGFLVEPRGYVLARSLCQLGRTEWLQREREQALRHFREGLLVMRDALIAGHALADCLDWLAAALGDAGQLVAAARLFGAAEAQWRASGAVRYAPERAAYAEDISRVRDQLDASTFAAAWAEGDAMNAGEAVDHALLLTGQ
jgi:tetratricopeptide (TPR) repeat protein